METEKVAAIRSLVASIATLRAEMKNLNEAAGINNVLYRATARENLSLRTQLRLAP